MSRLGLAAERGELIAVVPNALVSRGRPTQGHTAAEAAMAAASDPA